MPLFERVIELRVGSVDITGLDIDFNIEKDLTPEPNPCHVEIFNLGRANREILSKSDRVPVLLKAGYKGKASVIFQGDMLSCKHTKEGATWKTVLASGDGAAAIQSARINKSFSKGTPVKSVIEEIAEQLKLPGSWSEKFKSIVGSLKRGFCANGPAMPELNRLLEGHGLSASVQNQALQILKQGATLEKQTLDLSASSGLKGSPQMGSDKKIQVQTLLMPEIVPGMKVHIDSEVFKGFVAIESVRFSGANFGSQWGADIVAKVV